MKAIAAVTASLVLAVTFTAPAWAAPPGPTGPLTAGALKVALPTAAEVPGFTFDPAEDSSTVTATPDTLVPADPACQKFLDSSAALSTTYGTVAEADRTFHGVAGRTIGVSVMSFPDAAGAAAVLADTKAGIHGCPSLDGTVNGTPAVATISVIPQLEGKADRTGYVSYLTTNGHPVLVASQTVQVGSTIVEVELIGPQTRDDATLHAMGSTLGQVTDTVTGKLTASAA